MTDPYRTIASVDDPPLIFASRQEERVWREFLVAIVRSGACADMDSDLDSADCYLRAWRDRGGNDPK